MSCCGKKREEMQRHRQIYVTPNPAPDAPAGPRTPVIFLGTGAYLVSGPHSREVYAFSSSEPEQLVDAKDAAALIGSGLFQAKS
jgi:hypothetical protein